MRPRSWGPLLALLILAACGTAEVPPAPMTASDPGAEIGTARARSFLAVEARIEPVAEARCRELNPKADCNFRIVVDDRPGMPPNAFQTLDRQGRPILAITAGLLGEVRNDDELAFVMAHEASHHILGHLARQDQVAALGAQVFGEIAAREAGATPESVRRAQQVGAQVGARTFSKDFELEADRMGAEVAAQAGYDPLVGAAFFLRIPDPPNVMFGTHPSNAERIAVVREAAAEMGFR